MGVVTDPVLWLSTAAESWGERQPSSYGVEYKFCTCGETKAKEKLCFPCGKSHWGS